MLYPTELLGQVFSFFYRRTPVSGPRAPQRLPFDGRCIQPGDGDSFVVNQVLKT